MARDGDLQGEPLGHDVARQRQLDVLDDLGRGHVQEKSDLAQVDGHDARSHAMGESGRSQKRPVTARGSPPQCPPRRELGGSRPKGAVTR